MICDNGNAQQDSAYSIIVAGHAYGAHAGTNIGLHPPFLEKLRQNVDSTYKYIFLTGDIINQSTTESWQQVETELSEIGANAYYVMGNHDNNSVGQNEFQQKFGGTHYSFSSENEIFIVLNSTESDRSISSSQLSFLDEVLKSAAASQNRVFIFFHEIIWNSLEKYQLVRSNSRSRYDQMKDHSNFWDEVYPLLTAYQEKEFYLFAGDVGGNPDAISASYDKWENVTLLSSGMGEVADENYMKVDILPDTVEFTLIPLHDDVEMHSIQWYNVPVSPVIIEGPDKISSPSEGIKYIVEPVFNATSYKWSLEDGMQGESDSTSINIDFDTSFKSGEISVSAVNNGFGVSNPFTLEIKSDDQTSANKKTNFSSSFTVSQNSGFIQINYQSERNEKAHLRIYNLTGNLLLSEDIQMNNGINSKIINNSNLGYGGIIIELTSGTKKYIQKRILFH